MNKRRLREIDQIVGNLIAEQVGQSACRPSMCQIWLLVHDEDRCRSAASALVDVFNIEPEVLNELIDTAVQRGCVLCCTMPKDCAETKMRIMGAVGATNDAGYDLLVKYVSA